MMSRVLGGLVFVLVVAGVALADETQGTVIKVEDDAITIRVGGGKKDAKPEEKTFKVSKDTKIIRPGGKDKDDIKLSVDELKTAVKVMGTGGGGGGGFFGGFGGVGVTITHEGETVSQVKIGRTFGGKGKDKAKDN